MNEAKHIPGPWEIEKNMSSHYSSIGGALFIRGPKGEYIARLTDETPPRMANAKLITAAPKMLLTLQDIYAFLKRSGYDVRLVKDAIAEATE